MIKYKRRTINQNALLHDHEFVKVEDVEELMTNEIKLLRAFIEASGFEVEEITKEEKPKETISNIRSYKGFETVTSYKVTKKDSEKLTMDDPDFSAGYYAGVRVIAEARNKK